MITHHRSASSEFILDVSDSEFQIGHMLRTTTHRNSLLESATTPGIKAATPLLTFWPLTTVVSPQATVYSVIQDTVDIPLSATSS